MKIVVCPDSFKGSLSAKQVSHCISQKLRQETNEANIIEIPLADGGEGTNEIMCDQYYPIRKVIKAHNPAMKLIDTEYYQDISGKKAFIESAKIIGLPLLELWERNPLITTSRGLGELIIDAINSGSQEITIALGGSATCDGGKDMLDLTLQYRETGIKFNVLNDVKNPLLGENGAANVYAIQKGAKPSDIPILEQRLGNFFNDMVEKGFSKIEDKNKEGAGAAGGLGYAFQSILKAEFWNGIDFIMELVQFDEKIRDADLLITGEGKIDKQSLMGKVISGVIKKAQKYSIPVIGICGLVENKELLLNEGLHKIITIANPELSLKENLQSERAIENFKKIAILENLKLL